MCTFEKVKEKEVQFSSNGWTIVKERCDDCIRVYAVMGSKELYLGCYADQD